jgi:hypothetical protein
VIRGSRVRSPTVVLGDAFYSLAFSAIQSLESRARAARARAYAPGGPARSLSATSIPGTTAATTTPAVELQLQQQEDMDPPARATRSRSAAANGLGLGKAPKASALPVPKARARTVSGRKSAVKAKSAANVVVIEEEEEDQQHQPVQSEPPYLKAAEDTLMLPSPTPVCYSVSCIACLFCLTMSTVRSTCLRGRPILLQLGQHLPLHPSCLSTPCITHLPQTANSFSVSCSF